LRWPSRLLRLQFAVVPVYRRHIVPGRFRIQPLFFKQ
jgi:hypothetical protein